MPTKSFGTKLKEKWTVLLLPSGSAQARQVQASPRAVLLVIGAIVFAVAATIFVVDGGPERIQARDLARKNQVMAEELAGIRQQVASLEGEVEALAEQNAQARSLAGLASIDAEVLQAGVGGPGTITPRSHPLWGLDSLYSQDAFATSFDLTALQRRVQLLGTSLTEAADSLNSHQDWLESLPSILPARGYVSSGYSTSRVHPIHHMPLPHEGIDIATAQGTPIIATAKGTVSSTRRRDGYGLTVIIEHGFGYETLYGHASQILVRAGQEVERGEVIALVGRTGITTGANVHYEVRQNGRPTNPLRFVVTAIP